MLTPLFLNWWVATQKCCRFMGSSKFFMYIFQEKMSTTYWARKTIGFSNFTRVLTVKKQTFSFSWVLWNKFGSRHHDKERQCGSWDSTSCPWLTQWLESQALQFNGWAHEWIFLDDRNQRGQTQFDLLVGVQRNEEEQRTQARMKLIAAVFCRWIRPSAVVGKRRLHWIASSRCAVVSPSLINIAWGAVVKPYI